MNTDSRTVSEIAADAENMEPEEVEEEGLEEAQSQVTEKTFLPQPETLAAALKFAKPISQAREDAHVPPQVSIKDLVGKTFVIADKVRQKAFLPADGTSREGWQCLCVDVETEKSFTVWVGQVTLKKDLELLMLPIRVTLGKRGRAYIFS